MSCLTGKSESRHLTELFMISSSQEGVVVNISSLTAQVPTPLLSVYAGSKSFVETLTLNLQEEYHGQGLIFQCVSPGPVVGNQSWMEKESHQS